MAGEWVETTLGDLADFFSGGTPSKSRPDFWRGFVPWVSAKDMKRFRIEDTEDHVSQEAAANGTRLVPAGTVFLLTRGMTLLKDVPICVAQRPMTFNQDIKALQSRPHVASEYLPYVLIGNKERLLSKVDLAGHGTGRLNTDELKALDIGLPTLPEQCAIAHILGTLDDKIELNRLMSETLEAMARAHFKSWFVDFDPVRAKADGRHPSLPKHIADLFPDRLIDSELGEIPEGWRSSRLGTEVDTVLGGTPSRAEPSYWGGDIPWINSGKANEFRVIEPSEFITGEGLASSATKILPPRTTIIAITGATLGQISLTEISTCANQSIVAALGTSRLPSEYIYFWTREHIDELLAWQTGGAQQHINKNNVNDLPVVCPTDPVIAEYLKCAGPAFDRIRACCLESRTLAALRDTLLPKLIFGEVRIEDAETFMERVAS